MVERRWRLERRLLRRRRIQRWRRRFRRRRRVRELVMELTRLPAHLVAEFTMRRHFPPQLLDRLQQAIAAGETRHDGQLCFAVEGAQNLRAWWRGTTPRQRAEEVFAHLRVWDTHNNSGVLIYVLLAERAIEIVADRGISAKVAQSEWVSICERMRASYAAHEFERGSLDGIAAVTELLAAHFPPQAGKQNELSDRPVLL
jgi:uncharacterized membrane protein